MLVRTKQSRGRYSTRVRLRNEKHSFAEEFRYLGHDTITNCRDDKDIKYQFRGEILLAICWSGSSHLYQWRQKSNCSSNIVAQFMDVLFIIIHSRTLLENTFKRPINVLRYPSSSLAFAMNATDHINVLFRKFAYSLMSRVAASSNSIVTAIVNSDVYHQSALINKWGEYVICIGLIIRRIISQYVAVLRMTL